MSDIAFIRSELKRQSEATRGLYQAHDLCQKEVEDQKRKLDKSIASGNANEEWDIKNAEEIFDKNIKDSADRLGKAVAKLRDLIAAAREEPELQEDFLKAEETIEEVSA